MTRAIFEPEHEAFRETVGTFLDKEAVPHHSQWEKDGIVDREVWAKGRTQGLLGLQLPEEYGGGGITTGRRRTPTATRSVTSRSRRTS